MKRSVILDLAFVLIAFAGVRAAASLAGLGFGGAVAVVGALLVASWRLRVAGQQWKTVGLACPSRKWTVPVVAFVVFLTIGAVYTQILTPVLESMGLRQQGTETFDYLRGNLVALILSLVLLAWGTAAFGEELLFRGFIMDRLTRLFGGGTGPALGAALVQAVVFGLPHAYQGIFGLIATGVIGFIMGAAFLLGGRSLWPLIIAHGAVDTLSLIQVYLS